MTDKNRYGQYFTKEVIAGFMTSLIRHDRSADVLEPSCGKGVFLEKLAEQGFTRLSAYEIDSALEIPFDFVRRESFVSSPLSERYDVVIGNPPYIRWKNLESELKEELATCALWNEYFNSLCDYLFIFLLKSVEQLRTDGELIFICPEYWLNTTHAQSLRDYLCRHGHITDIYQFKEAPLFDKVTSSHIIFRYVKSTAPATGTTLYRYTGKGMPGRQELMERSCFRQTVIPAFRPGSRWLLASGEEQDRLMQFERACRKGGLFDNEFHRIGDFCDIGNGMVSGLDAAFRIDDYEQLNDREKACTIEVLKAKSLRQYSHEQPAHYIYMPEGEFVEEKDFRTLYPHFHKQLAPYKEKLDARYQYGREIPYREFVFPRNRRLFERPEYRILVPCKERISHKSYFRFSLAEPGLYPLQDVTGIFRKPHCRESVEYLTAFLNNDRVFDWLCLNGIVKGNVVEFSETPIAGIPYRPINWDDHREVDLHDQITGAARGLACNENVQTNTEIVKETFNLLFHETN